MKALVVGLLALGLAGPDPRGSFGSAAACAAAATAWQGQARDGARWVAVQRDQAKAQPNESIDLFWRQAVSRAAEQEARARSARCAERS